MTVRHERLDRRDSRRRCPVFTLLATPRLFALVAEHVSKWEDTSGTNPEEGISSRVTRDQSPPSVLIAAQLGVIKRSPNEHSGIYHANDHKNNGNHRAPSRITSNGTSR